jgi:hypothetical protein
VLPRPTFLMLAVPLLAAACGGSSGSASQTTTTTTATLQTQARFVQQGNQVCIRADRRIFRIGRLTRDPAGWAKTAAAGRVSMHEMRGVAPSARSEAAFRRMLTYGDQLVAAIQAVHDDLAGKKYQAAVNAQFKAARLQDFVHEQAKAAGLTFCQQNLTSWPV